MKICTVLRSGGEYKPEHAQRLAQQVQQHSPEAEFFVLSDVFVPGVEVVPMLYQYPGWWSKIELMALPGDDFLCLDLDSSVVGALDEMAKLKQAVFVDDFYHPGRISSGVMFLPPEMRQKIWLAWLTQTPPAVMKQFRGDGEFIRAVCGPSAATWPQVLPGQVVSYKVHVQRDERKAKHVGNGFIPPGARVIAYHGKPRPWDVAEPRFQ